MFQNFKQSADKPLFGSRQSLYAEPQTGVWHNVRLAVQIAVTVGVVLFVGIFIRTVTGGELRENYRAKDMHLCPVAQSAALLHLCQDWRRLRSQPFLVAALHETIEEWLALWRWTVHCGPLCQSFTYVLGPLASVAALGIGWVVVQWLFVVARVQLYRYFTVTMPNGAAQTKSGSHNA